MSGDPRWRSRSGTRVGIALVAAVLAVLPAGCGTSTPEAATSTVLVTELTTSTATTVETTISTVVTTSVVVTTSTLVAPDPATDGPQNGPPCPADPSYVDEPVDGLAPQVVDAWAAAKSAAAAAGVSLCLNDGKRSVAQQEAQFDEYAARYGTDTAATLVLPPEKSAHVAGWAIDVQPAAAYTWLQQTDGQFGLCRMYDNEAWHFEWAASFTLGCPPRRAAPQG